MTTATGEIVEKLLEHAGDIVPDFYAALEGPVLVGIEATGPMRFPHVMEELAIK